MLAFRLIWRAESTAGWFFVREKNAGWLADFADNLKEQAVDWSYHVLQLNNNAILAFKFLLISYNNRCMFSYHWLHHSE
jgi:hypothetical protein